MSLRTRPAIRIFLSQLRRGLPRLAALLGLLSLPPAPLPAQTDPAGTGSEVSPSMWPRPFLSETNADSAAAEDHPELDKPPTDPTLSLQPGAGDGSVAPETSQEKHFASPEGMPEALPFHLLVVYNTRDRDSKTLAQYYAGRRGISADHVLGIPCSTSEEITRADFEATLRQPILSYIDRHGWMDRRPQNVRLGSRTLQLTIATRNDIWAMVLMRGVPLKIAEDPSDHDSLQAQPSLATNAAAVDSELATLPVSGLPLGGFLPNIFFDGAGDGIIRAGPELATKLILVTRLDGPRPADVRRMIDDSIYAEENRLAGLAVINARGLTNPADPYSEGDTFMRGARDALLKKGWSVDFSQPDLMPPTDPCNHVALYFGWYSPNANGPWITPPNRFVRGAIAYHLHSFSAATVRSTTGAWVGPLLAHGAAASMGTVYEPYLDLTPHIDIFTKRLLAGDYLAEAGYACQRGLSWMGTVVGDPLYRPFQVRLDDALARPAPSSSGHYDWMLVQQVQRDIANGQIDDSIGTLEKYLNIPGTVAQECLGDDLEKLHDGAGTIAAEQAYRRASELATLPIDRIRIGLKLAQAYNESSQHEEAQDELRTLRETFPYDSRRFAVADPLLPPGVSSNPTPTAPAPPSPSLAPPRPPSPPKPTPL